MAPLLKCLPLTAVLMILAIPANSEPLEYFGKPVRNVSNFWGS